MKESQDNIIEILKSIPKIKHTFSRKNKEFNKTFKTQSLDNLLRTIGYHPKIHDEYSPSPEFLNQRYQYDINFKNSENYIKEFSDLNNLPLVVSNRNCLKNGTFNPDYDLNPIQSKEEKKLIILEKERRKRERLQDRLERLKKWRESDSNLDPGKYHPNYDFIRKKITSVYIRQPIVKINNKNEEDLKKYKKNKENKKENKNNSNNKNAHNNQKVKEELKESDNKNINNSKNENDNKDHKENKNNSSINFNDSNSLNSSKISVIKNIKQKYGRNIKNTLLDKNSSTISDYNNTIDINKSTNIDELPSFHKDNNKKLNSVKNRHNKNLSLPKINPKKIKNIKRIKFKKNKFRKTSIGNIKNYIIFKKMLGRDDTLFENQNLNLISYSPNYESMMPHIPATIFKYKDDNQNYKKYITGKIIRGYNYTPEKYFVLEFQKNKIKKINISKEREKMKEILSKKIIDV